MTREVEPGGISVDDLPPFITQVADGRPEVVAVLENKAGVVTAPNFWQSMQLVPARNPIRYPNYLGELQLHVLPNVPRVARLPETREEGPESPSRQSFQCAPYNAEGPRSPISGYADLRHLRDLATDRGCGRRRATLLQPLRICHGLDRATPKAHVAHSLGMCNKAAAVVKKERREAMKLQLRLEHMYERALDLPTINPTDPLPVVVNEPSGTRSLVSASWGKPEAAIATMNARDDRLLESPLWSPLVANKRTRGVILLTHGFEPLTALTVQQMGRPAAVANVGEAAVKDAESGKTVWHGFKRRDGEPMLVAALVDVDDQQRRWATMVTTQAGPVFSRIHRAKAHGEEREIANLRSHDEVDEWLTGAMDYRGLLRGAGDDFLESWRCPPDAMKKDADPLLKMQPWSPPAEKQRTLF